MLNYMEEDENYCNEVVVAKMGVRSHSRNPSSLYMDLKNWEMQVAKSSIEEPPIVELKKLPNHL